MIKLGVVGMRNIGKGHMRRAQSVEGIEVIAGADTSPEICEQVKEEFGLDFIYDNADDLFANPDVDAVVLALPNHLHAPMTIKALQAGKHVLVEKPITGDSREVEAMIKARDESGKVLMVGMNQRFSAVQYALRKIIRDKVIGDIYLAKTLWNCRYPGTGLFGRGSWGFKKETSGGGPLLDLGIHKLDLLLFLMDFPEVDSVMGVVTSGIGKAECAKRGIDYDVEDFGMGLIRFKNGASIHFEASYFHNQQDMNVQKFFLSGTKGVIDEQAVSIVEAGEMMPVDYEPMESAPKTCIEHFCRVIRGEEELNSTCEQALTGLKIVEAVYESSQTGKPVYFK